MPNRLRERDARASTRGFPLRLAHWMKGFAIVLSLSATHAFAQQSPAPADGVYNLLVGTYTGAAATASMFTASIRKPAASHPCRRRRP